MTTHAPSASQRRAHSAVFGLAVAVASGVTGVIAHTQGGGMAPTLPVLVALATASVLIGLIARVMPRRTFHFTILMALGQLLGHGALSLTSASGVCDPHTAHLVTQSGSGGTNHMLLAHALGTVVSVGLVHASLKFVALANRVFARVLNRFVVPALRPGTLRRARIRLASCISKYYETIAPLRGPPASATAVRAA